MGKAIPKMLFVGDFPIQTGFGVVATNLINTFKKHYEVHVLAVNFFGDYHPALDGLRVYPASGNGSDIWGKNRINELILKVSPDVVFILNDPWIAMDYATNFQALKAKNPRMKTKYIVYTPIDAENVKQDFVDGLKLYDKVITYTEFGRKQLTTEFSGQSSLVYNDVSVVPHGVDTSIFHKVDMTRKQLREQMNLSEDDYVVLCLQRNQPRKRLDLTFYYFAEWVKRYSLPKNVKIYYHGALQDFGIDIVQWCEYLGIEDRLAISSPNIRPDAGLTPQQLNMVYNTADVFFTTTAAEGWCLPASEAMATGVPVILPRHSALAEWPEGNAHYMDVYKFPTLTDRGLNTIHHVTEMESAVEALHTVFLNETYRKNLGESGMRHITQNKFKWNVIAQQFVEIIDGVLKQD
jgi:glycosyltransferase involved in cell wall biosynthesis